MAAAKTKPQNETADEAATGIEFDDVQCDSCPNCTVGVLYVIRWDPDALHEAGQDLSAANQKPSGGAYETLCFVCNTRTSHPFADFDTDEGA